MSNHIFSNQDNDLALAKNISDFCIHLAGLGETELIEHITEGLTKIFPENLELKFNYCISLARDHSQKNIVIAKNSMIKFFKDFPEILENPDKHLSMIAYAAVFMYRSLDSENALKFYKILCPITKEASDYMRLAELLNEENEIGHEYIEALNNAILKDHQLNTEENRTALANAKKMNSTNSLPGIKIRKYPNLKELESCDSQMILSHLIDFNNFDLKFISENTKFFTMGSCFAKNINDALIKKGYTSEHLGLEEEANTTFANAAIVNALKVSKTNEEFLAITGGLVTTSFNLQDTLKNIKHADVFIFTLGVAAVFFNKKTGDSLFSSQIKQNWRSLSMEYEYRVTQVNENIENIIAVIEYIRSINNYCKVILTVSPVPILASFSNKSAVQTDCISKSTLRIAAEEICNNQAFKNVSYWPTFEIFRWVGSTKNSQFYEDHRHVAEEIVSEAVSAFISRFRK